jgi:hypothetical protein
VLDHGVSGPAFTRAVGERGVVVDDEDDLDRPVRLRLDGLDRGDELVPALLAVRADDD